jgi:ABC-type glycerol-3-phosphate transport system substrate-binding protein
MKTMMITLAFAGLATTGSAFAQSTTPAQTPAQAPTPVTVAQAGQWVPPDGQAIAPKTRAEVYQDLVKSEQDGQLDYLNRTLYWHH